MDEELPLQDALIWIDIEESNCPEIAKRLAKNIGDLRWDVNKITYTKNNDFRFELIFKCLERLSFIISDFLSVFQTSSEFIEKKDEQNTKKIINDLINMERELKSKVDNLLSRPPEKIYTVHFYQIKELISAPINSLIGVVLIEAFKNSCHYELGKRLAGSLGELSRLSPEDPVAIQLRESLKVKQEKFYEIFYTETIKRIGTHPIFTVFRTPTKTMINPVLSSADKRELVVGLYNEIKEEKNKDIIPTISPSEENKNPPENQSETFEELRKDDYDEDYDEDEEEEEDE